jgi:hypothetical protein
MVPIEVGMIEIETKDWTVPIWWEVIEWCSSTFGPCQADSWMWQDDYSFYISEKNLTFLMLRWG